MLILKIALIYMLVGALYEVWAFHVVQKCGQEEPEVYEDILRRWNNLPILIRFVVCIVISLEWPRLLYNDITDTLHR